MKTSRCMLWTVTVFLSLVAFIPSVVAAPAVITSCQAIKRPGSYVLGRNLFVPADKSTGDCLVIAANDVTIDLAGFKIGGRAKNGSGIKTDGEVRRGISVMNGTITGFHAGMDLGYTGTNVTVQSMRFMDNGGIGVDVNDICIIKDSIFYQNGQGIRAGSRSIVVGNTSNFNTNTGIQVAVGSRVEGNVADINGQHGIIVGGGSTTTNNTALGNEIFGLFVNCPGNVMGNTATSNGTNLQLQSSGCNSVNNIAP